MAHHTLTTRISEDEFFDGDGWDPGGAAIAEGRGVRYFRRLHREPALFLPVSEGLGDLAEMSGRAGVPVLVAVMPLMLAQGDGSYPLEGVHRRVLSKSLGEGLMALDLQPLIQGYAVARGVTLNSDFIHPNAAGTELAARGLLSWLIGSGQLPEDAVDRVALDRQFGLGSLSRWMRKTGHPQSAP
jgi:hypothetical protein